jgi:hypothetical protein
MTSTEGKPSGSFWTTIPLWLKGLAMLITAITGLITLLRPVWKPLLFPPTEVPVPRSAFSVIGVLLGVDHPNYDGPCPVQLKFSGHIEASGSGTVAYRFLRSHDPQPGQETVPVEHGKSKPFENTWTVGKPGERISGWEQLQIISPGNASSSQEHFTINCH